MPGGGGLPGRGGKDVDSGPMQPAQSGKRDQADKPDAGLSGKTSEAQLESFQKMVNPDLLKKAGVSEEEYRRYLATRKKQIEESKKGDIEKGPVTPGTIRSAPSLAARKVTNTATEATNAGEGNRALPPPGYRDAYKEFTRRIAEMEKQGGLR